MNCIVLEGVEIYSLVIGIAAIGISGVIGILSAIRKEKEVKRLLNVIKEHRKREVELNGELLVLKLKHGEL